MAVVVRGDARASLTLEQLARPDRGRPEVALSRLMAVVLRGDVGASLTLEQFARPDRGRPEVALSRLCSSVIAVVLRGDATASLAPAPSPSEATYSQHPQYDMRKQAAGAHTRTHDRN
jgi:hypothetical protein